MGKEKKRERDEEESSEAVEEREQRELKRRTDMSREQRQLEEFVKLNKAQIQNINSSVADESIKAANSLFAKIRTVQETVLDSKTMKDISFLVGQQVHNVAQNDRLSAGTIAMKLKEQWQGHGEATVDLRGMGRALGVFFSGIPPI